MPSLFWDSTFAELVLILEYKKQKEETIWQIARFMIFKFFQTKVKNPNTLKLRDILVLPSDKKDIPEIIPYTESEYKDVVAKRLAFLKDIKLNPQNYDIKSL